MIKLLASLFALIEKALGLYHDKQMEEQGRQKVEEALNENVAKAKDTLATSDPERDDRLRNRFDKAHSGK